MRMIVPDLGGGPGSWVPALPQAPLPTLGREAGLTAISHPQGIGGGGLGEGVRALRPLAPSPKFTSYFPNSSSTDEPRSSRTVTGRARSSSGRRCFGSKLTVMGPVVSYRGWKVRLAF